MTFDDGPKTVLSISHRQARSASCRQI